MGTHSPDVALYACAGQLFPLQNTGASNSVGDALGIVVGDTLGLVLGLVVGDTLGYHVGDVVGARVGSR